MNRPRARPTSALLFAVASALLAACSGSEASGIPGNGAGGFTGSGGSAGVAQLPSTWIAEIDPPSSSSAAITFSADLVKQNPTLQMDSQANVTATFTAPSNAPVPAKATAILTVPSPIAGRPPLTFQAPATVSSAGVLTASLTVPEKLIGIPVTLTLVPIPPADQQNPPYTFSTVLATSMQATIASDNFTIGGSLLTAVAQVPQTTFVAQAFQGGALVSNAPLTQQSNGSFQLVIPSAVLAVGLPLTVQLTPQSTTDPWFVSMPVAASDSAPFPMPILLAATNGPPNYFSLAVEDSSQGGVSGAVVQAQVTLGMNTYGSTLFSRTATTTDGTGGTTKGVATLSLFSGSDMTTAFIYSFAVVPPANSPNATTCTASPVKVFGGGASASTAQALPAIVLNARTVLSGTVFDGDGSPMSNVAVAATPGPDPVPGCSGTPAASASATTDVHGLFTLYLDPGTYQLDYDPPPGSAAPRLTEYGIVVGGGSLSHDVDLPVAGLFEGTVLAPDMTALPSATIRIYEPRCDGTDCTAPNPPAPVLRAQALTDANGIFRVAVPSSGN
jgi:hypothetical protein